MTNSKQEVLLAVDGGGTKTVVWVADLEGKILGKGKSGPMSLAATSAEIAIQNLFEALHEALPDHSQISIKKAVIGAAGVDTDDEIKVATKVFHDALKKEYDIEELVLVNDIRIALESGATSPNAIALISGTGSNCFGKNEKGETAKAGGMDFLLSDQGSGYDIGQKVLRAVIKAYDGRGPSTVMEELICQHFHISDLGKLKDHVYHPILNKTQIGQLAKICFEALERQDTVANEIINGAIEELVLMISAVVRKLNLMHTHADVVLVGGIATDPYMKKQLEKRLNSRFSKLKLIVPEEPAVSGALKMALS